MAFLCPSRVGRKTKVRTPRKKDKPFAGLPGRITGSDSTDTIQRVGLEKESGLSPKSKVRVILDFEPCVDEEVAVKRGEEVYLLYKENDWGYVIKRNGEEGFIPYSYCTRLFGPESLSSDMLNRNTKYGTLYNEDVLGKDCFFTDEWSPVSSKPDSVPDRRDPTTHKGIITREEMIRILQPPPPVVEEDKPDVRPFRKTSHGQFIALFDFSALDENDTNVERAELVDVLNIEDPDWSWIRHCDGREGFVPKSYICPVEPLKAIEKAVNGGHSRQSSATGRSSASSSILGPKNHHRASNNTRTGHPYLSQPALNVTTNTKRSLNDASFKLSMTYASSDAVNKHQDMSNIGHGTLSNFHAFNESTSTLPSPTSQVITIRPPTRAFSQTITQNDQHEAGLSTTFKPLQCASDSDFDDPACASSLPTTPRYETSNHSQTDSMKGSQTDRVVSVPSKHYSNETTHLSNKSTDKEISLNQQVSTATNSVINKTESNNIYANVPLQSTQPDDERAHDSKANDNVIECVILYDYTARSQDDLTVRRGENVYDDGRNRGNAHWLWVFSPRAKSFGYVPRQYVKQVVQTSL
ncbi:SH3 domain-containing protein Dlish-like [Ylistrum balloti]|uniref:SH3 domain-containing protein Dlish-like n=1 Tax=Ylistrum balloti TaxID=509963 RepID=UPI002905D9DF|nr:SH3 domain-containing protein Dlish-like [Ylistrum balloti]